MTEGFQKTNEVRPETARCKYCGDKGPIAIGGEHFCTIHAGTHKQGSVESSLKSAGEDFVDSHSIER